MMPKVDDFTGQYMQITVQTGAAQGASANLTNALANYSANNYSAFQLRRLPYYAAGRISGELIRAGRSDKDSLVRALDQEQKGTLRTLSRQISHAIFGNGGGALGQVGAIGPGAGLSFPDRGITVAPTLAANQLQLADPSQIVWFEVDATHVVSATDGTTGAIRTGTPVHVTSVNRSNGVVTYDVNIGTAGTAFAAVAVNDYVFLQGDFGAKLHGLSGWVPPVDPAPGTTFLNVDRAAIDVTRLAGLRYNGGGAPIEETLQSAMAFAYQEGSSADTAVLNPIDMERLLIALNSRSVIQNAVNRSSADVPTIGYQGVKIASINGTCDVFADPGCPKGRAWILQLDTWKVHHLGEFPGYLEEDGLTILRDQSTDSYVWRMGFYADIACEAPALNMCVTL